VTAFEVRHLQPWEEACGPLHELQERDGCIVATIGPVVVALPTEIGEKLSSFMGKRIGVLRTEGDYRFKVLTRR
jgi:hypothetical protein